MPRYRQDRKYELGTTIRLEGRFPTTYKSSGPKSDPFGPGFRCQKETWDNSVLISEALDLVKKGLDLLDGKLPSLASENPFGDMLPAAADSCIAAVANFKGVAMDPSASLLKQATAGSLTLSEQGGQVDAALSLKAGKEETAAQMAKVVRGIVAFAILGEPQNPTMAALARHVNVSTNDGATTINLTAPAAEIIACIAVEKTKAEARKSSAPTRQP